MRLVKTTGKKNEGRLVGSDIEVYPEALIIIMINMHMHKLLRSRNQNRLLQNKYTHSLLFCLSPAFLLHTPPP